MTVPPVHSASTRPLRLLALGTSTDWCSVALLDRGADGVRVDISDEQTGNAQSRRLLPTALALLRARGLGLRDLDAVAFDAGPGAFTGLRIGCGVAQGLGFALNLPLFPVMSLEALAFAARARSVLAAIDARMGEVYCASFIVDAGMPGAGHALEVLPIDSAAARIADWRAGLTDPATAIAVGDAFERHPALAEACLQAGIAVLCRTHPCIESLARIAAARFDANAGVLPAAAAPVYVRDKVALDVDEQRRLRSAKLPGRG